MEYDDGLRFDWEGKTSLRASPSTVAAGVGLLDRVLTLVRDVSAANRPRPRTPYAPLAPLTEVVTDEDSVLPFRPRESDPAPAPAPVTEAEAEANAKAALIDVGRQAFGRLAHGWMLNFGVLDAPQPDRPSLLVAAFTGYRAGCSAYVRDLGGLSIACIDALLLGGLVSPNAANLLGRKIALNMVQVGSLVGIGLDRLLERGFYAPVSNPEVSFDDPDARLLATPLTGGVAGDSIDFDNRAEPGEDNHPSLFGDTTL